MEVVNMAKMSRLLGPSFFVCAVMAAMPSIARAQPAIVYEGKVNNEKFCIWGRPSFDAAIGMADAAVYTDKNCGVYDGRVLVPFTSREVSVYPIVWYLDSGTGWWYQCQVATETKVSFSHTAYQSTYVPNCPHQRYISVWAHVAARPTSDPTWYGGDVYGDPVWYP
jgi:hypothetical protein